MPVQYRSIIDEHTATRSAVGMFDVSHMGRLRFSGADAADFLDYMVTRRVADLRPGQIRYGLVTNDQAGILDDVLVYRLADADGAEYQMVVNASNREKILDWLNQHAGDYDVRIDDATLETAMIAVQGPQAISLVQPLVDCELAGMKYYRCGSANLAGHQALVSRTGYTGEDGCELIVPSEDAEAVWEVVLGAGHSVGAQPAGLGCRDTLRLEAAMPLYGHELSEVINPVQAGLAFAYNLEDRNFIGRDAIARFEKDASLPRRIGLSLSGKRVPREGCPIEIDGRRVGEVTSGTFSPTLSRPIAMGYVEPDHAAEGTKLAIDIRGRREPAEVVSLPFYKRPH